MNRIKHKALTPGLYQEIIDIYQREIELSQHTPYRQISKLFAGVYCASLCIIALFIRLFHNVSVTRLHKQLAERYYHVPEMTIHKSLELEMFLQQHYNGSGLDLGCGDGLVGGLLIWHGGLSKLHGLDSKDFGCGVLGNGYTSFTMGDMQVLPYASQSFDYAISICVIEHVPDLENMLSEIARVLKSEGRLFFSTPSPLFRESTLGYRFFTALKMPKKAEVFKLEKDINSIQYHYLSEAEWNSALQNAGFTDIEIQHFFSRSQLLAYDFMNISFNWLRFSFASKLLTFFNRHLRLKKIMILVIETISAHFSTLDVKRTNATHYFIRCAKRDNIIA